MAWTNSISDVLNVWADMGVFNYVIPFLLIFAVVFAILQKTKILGDNRAVEAIIAVAIGLLSIQFDFVSTFFAEIFPRFGVGLSIFLVLIIFLGFFYHSEDGKVDKLKWVGFVVGVGVVVWAIADWSFWRGNTDISFWFREYFWSLVILAAVIAIIAIISRSGGDKPLTTT